MILRDFEEIDQYLVDTQHLFTGIKTQKELEEAFYFLDEEDQKTIQSFWSSFLPDTTQTQKQFLETWRILLPLYRGFKQRLKPTRIVNLFLYHRFISSRTMRCTED